MRYRYIESLIAYIIIVCVGFIIVNRSDNRINNTGKTDTDTLSGADVAPRPVEYDGENHLMDTNKDDTSNMVNTQSDYDAQKDVDEGQNIKNVLCSEKSKEKANDNVTAVSGIRYCRKCGNKLEPGSRFCNICGLKIELV